MCIGVRRTDLININALYRLAFADTRQFVADPAKVAVPVDALLSHEYGAARARLINPMRATADVETGSHC
jgi:gamma-glutamyltranspeptidase